MTKEEQSIAYMEQVRNELIDYWEDYKHENHEVQYYDMAIAALKKQEPTTKNDLAVDCISRADADAVIEEMRVKLKDGRMYILAEVVQDIIRELPSVTPQEPRWIPVSERLPEPFTFVNATCRSLVDDRENWVIETVYLPIPKEVNKHGYSDWGNIPMLNQGEAEVIAWVERIIPQPYKVEIEPQESGDKE